MTVSEHIRISIHSTARVETDYSMGPGQVNIIFQSTPPRGWRHIHLCPWLHFHIISIHSTARVETWMTCISALLPEFQSTPPRGWRPGSLLHFPILCNFNPLHREGGDVIERINTLPMEIFQSTPPRGWRHKKTPTITCENIISIHSTARVETFFVQIPCLIIPGFQSTPPRGWRRFM